MLDKEFRRYLPGLFGAGIGIVGTVELKDAGISHDRFRLGGIHEGTMHVDVAVQDIVLGILMGSVYPFFGKENRYLRPGNTAYVGMKVDGSAHFFFDGVEGLAGCADLFSADRNAADTLGCAFDQSVNVGLAGGADHHDVIGAMPSCHAHTAQIILETARGDFRGDYHVTLGIDVAEGVGGGQGN